MGVKRRVRKRKFGMDLDRPDDTNEGDYALEQTPDENLMDMDVRYQEDTDSDEEDIVFDPDEQDPVKRAEQAQRMINRLRGNNEENISGSSIDLGNRMHEENVDHAENISENMEDLITIFHNNTSDGFDLYKHSIEEKIKFTEIINTKVFEKLKRSRQEEIDTVKTKIISIENIIKDLKDEKKLLKTAS